jgi:hypothetical protein
LSAHSPVDTQIRVSESFQQTNLTCVPAHTAIIPLHFTTLTLDVLPFHSAAARCVNACTKAVRFTYFQSWYKDETDVALLPPVPATFSQSPASCLSHNHASLRLCRFFLLRLTLLSLFSLYSCASEQQNTLLIYLSNS